MYRCTNVELVNQCVALAGWLGYDGVVTKMSPYRAVWCMMVRLPVCRPDGLEGGQRCGVTDMSP